MKRWKKIHKVSKYTKVFQVSGGVYKDLINALLERGWVRNTNFFSPCFDYKWSLHKRDIPYRSLEN